MRRATRITAGFFTTLLLTGLGATADAKGSRTYRVHSAAPKQVRTFKPNPAPKAPARLAPRQPIPSAATRASTTSGAARAGARTLGIQRRAVATERNVTTKGPNGTAEKKVVTHPSGRRDVFTASKRDAQGNIDKTHSHTVLNKARQVHYARTADKKVLVNKPGHVVRNDAAP